MTISYDRLAINNLIVLDVPHIEGAGLAAHDISRSHSNLTISPTTLWVALPSGISALGYGGDLSGDFLQCPAAAATGLDFTAGDFTLLAWVYSLGTGSGSDMVMCKSTTDADGWEFYVTIPNLRTISLRTNQAGSHTGISAIGALTLDAWQLIGVTRHGATGQFYVNGQPVTTTLGTGLLNPIAPVTRKLLVGIQHDEINNTFEGMMRHHRAWARALSAVEMLAIFTKERLWYGV